LVTRKAVAAAKEELAANPRSRSAKLRVAERMDVIAVPNEFESRKISKESKQ
jgi:hypothetical protein